MAPKKQPPVQSNKITHFFNKVKPGEYPVLRKTRPRRKTKIQHYFAAVTSPIVVDLEEEEASQKLYNFVLEVNESIDCGEDVGLPQVVVDKVISLGASIIPQTTGDVLLMLGAIEEWQKNRASTVENLNNWLLKYNKKIGVFRMEERVSFLKRNVDSSPSSKSSESDFTGCKTLKEAAVKIGIILENEKRFLLSDQEVLKFIDLGCPLLPLYKNHLELLFLWCGIWDISDKTQPLSTYMLLQNSINNDMQQF